MTVNTQTEEGVFLKFIYFERERERAHERAQVGEGQGENPKQAPHC